MTNESTLEEKLESFGHSYMLMYNLGIDGEFLTQLTQQFATIIEDSLKPKPKPEPKVFYQIFMRASGKPWGSFLGYPKFITHGEAKKFLFDYYSEFKDGHQLHINNSIYHENWWNKTYDIRKVTKEN